MKELTKAEEQVMQILWGLKAGFAKDIRECFKEPKPAITTVSTILRILQEKGFVGYKAYGKAHEYYPLVEKPTYTRLMMKGILLKYFGNSLRQMVSFFSREKGLTVSELEELKKIIDEEIRKHEDQSQ
jgi:BlaI family transcriptional regulator, penicillinase repressor